MPDWLRELLSLTGPLIGYWWKARVDEKAAQARERRERERARELLADPEGPNDPKQAVAQAALEHQADRLAEQTRKVRDSMNPPFGNPTVPPLNIDVEIVDDKK